jgi:hypothetical protein
MMKSTLELAEAARRVLAYVRGRQLLSNVDPEEISEVSVMPPGAGEPMTFRLLSSDLEALTLQHIEPRCADRVPDNTGVTKTRTCGLTLDANGACPRPKMEHES